MVQILNFLPDIPEGKLVETINLKKLPLPPEFIIEKIHFSHLNPGSWAGNHKHSRVEVFVSYTQLLFVWLDERGVKHEDFMGRGEDGSIKVFVVEAQTPHLIFNKETTAATYIELCDGDLDDVVKMDLQE